MVTLSAAFATLTLVRCFISVLLFLLPAYIALVNTTHVPTRCYNKRCLPIADPYLRYLEAKYGSIHSL